MTDSRKYSYHTDGQGSVLSLTDSLGVKSNTYSYTAFGTTKAQTGTAINPWLYTGRQYDSESGLYFNRNRYYNPGLGRFMTRDPIGIRGGVNLYAYADNSPVDYIDSFGLMALPIGGGAGGPGAGGGTPPSGIPDNPNPAPIPGIGGGKGGFPDPNNPPSNLVPHPNGKPDIFKDPSTGETWKWHDDPFGKHGGSHWDIGGPKGKNGEKGKQDWWPEGGDRGPKPPGSERQKNSEALK